jgi:transposase
MDVNPGMIEPIREQGGRETMRSPEEVSVILELQRKGWGAKRIARELGVSKNTVRRYLRAEGWQPHGRPALRKVLDEHSAWVAEQYSKHHGSADVVRQELKRSLGLEVSLRTVERALAPLRREVRASSVATVRFETPRVDWHNARGRIEPRDVVAYASCAHNRRWRY